MEESMREACSMLITDLVLFFLKKNFNKSMVARKSFIVNAIDFKSQHVVYGWALACVTAL